MWQTFVQKGNLFDFKSCILNFITKGFFFFPLAIYLQIH